MPNITEECKLPLEKLRKRADINALNFQTTEELPCLEKFIGQERAVKAFSFGLAVESKGYNIFVLGNPGSGRTTYSLERLRETALERKAPDDWIYVYNFDDPSRPLAINLSAGKGKEMGAAFEDLLEELKIAISKAFEKSQYEDAKAQLVKKFQEQVNSLMEEVRAWAGEKGFALKRTPQGFVNIPLTEEVSESGETSRRELQQDEFESLPEEKQKELQVKSEEISQKTLDTLRKIRDLEKALKEEINKLEAEICRSAITPYLQDIKDKYGTTEILCKWIDNLTEDIISNFNIFVAAAKDESAEIDFSRYTINVFVANDPENGAPVIWETNPTYYNLTGKVEYESRQGYLYTDFHKIVPGAFQKANGGYLILDAEKVLLNFMSWEALKRALRTGEANIENLGEQYGAIPVSSLRPQPIPIKMKVVMVGTPYLYALLQYYDPEFLKMFKIKADFDSDNICSATQDMGCIEAMEKLIRLHFEFLQGNPTYVRLILWENLNQGKHFQKNDFRDARDPSLIQIRKVIRKGKAEGVFRESVEEDQFLLSLITFSFPYFSNRYTLSKLLGMSMDKAEDLNKRVNHVTEILLSYLCREDYRKKKPSNKNGR